MASILCVSAHGNSIPLALRMAQEGHVVRVMYENKDLECVLSGYRNPSSIPWSVGVDAKAYDLILFDSVGSGDIADKMKERERIVLSGGTFNDKLTLDREYGERVALQLMKSVEIEGGGKLAIQTCEDLLKAVSTSEGLVTIKPLSTGSTWLTLTEMKKGEYLKSVASVYGESLLPCIVHDAIDGVEISTEGWFNGEMYVSMNHTLERKRFLPGDIGFNEGSAGSIVWITHGDRLSESTLTPLLPLLKKVKYIGPISVKCTVNAERVYFTGFNAGFSYDSIQALSELIRGSLFDFFWNVAVKGKLPPTRSEYALALRLSVPPYPYGKQKDYIERSGVKYLNVSDEAKGHVWFSDVKWNTEHREVLAGYHGILGCITGRGSTLGECRRRVQRTLDNVVLSKDIQYRLDLTKVMEEDLSKLRKWGWMS